MRSRSYYERVEWVARLNIFLACLGETMLHPGSGLFNACIALGLALHALVMAKRHGVAD